MAYIFDILILIISIFIIVDFKKGYIYMLCSLFLCPISLQVGSFTLSAKLFYLIPLTLSFIVNKQYLKFKGTKKIIKPICIYVVGTFFLIYLSAKVVPISFQIYSLIRDFILMNILYFVFGIYSLGLCSYKDLKPFLLSLGIAGVYGILTYVIGFNPLTIFLNTLYNVDVKVDILSFAEERRGVLTSRVWGTMGHPLSWGQFWGLAIPILLFYFERYKNKYCILLLVIGIINVFLSGSRAALVQAALAIILINLKWLVSLKCLKYVIPVFLLIVLFLNFDFQNKGIESFKDQLYSSICFWDDSRAANNNIAGSSYDMRQNQLEASFYHIRNNILFGLGYNLQMYLLEGKTGGFSDMLGFESILFKLLVEQGIVGFLFFAVFYFEYFKVYFTRKSLNKIYTIAYFLSFCVSILTTGIQDTWLYFLLLPILFVLKFDVKNYEYTQKGCKNICKSKI